MPLRWGQVASDGPGGRSCSLQTPDTLSRLRFPLRGCCAANLVTSTQPCDGQFYASTWPGCGPSYGPLPWRRSVGLSSIVGGEELEVKLIIFDAQVGLTPSGESLNSKN